MEQDLIIIVSVVSVALGLLAVGLLVLCCLLSKARREIRELQARPAMRVQKLTLDPRDGHHAFQNPAIVPDEELSKRGYSMYVGDDVESQRATERQTGGQFVEELSKEIESRQLRNDPPFLLQSIEDKRRTRELNNPANPLANQNSKTLPNNQSKFQDQNYQQNGRSNSQIQNQNDNAQNQRVDPFRNDESVQKQNSFLHNQDLQNFNTHLQNHNQRSNARQSETNPNFIY